LNIDSDRFGNKGDNKYEVKLPKLDFSLFEGNGLGEWVSKCMRYFELYNILEVKKLNIIELYLKGEAFI
jgi:hypothetical protein